MESSLIFVFKAGWRVAVLLTDQVDVVNKVRLHTQDACGSRALCQPYRFLFLSCEIVLWGGWSMTQLIPNMSMVRNPSLTSGTAVGQKDIYIYIYDIYIYI